MPSPILLRRRSRRRVVGPASLWLRLLVASLALAAMVAATLTVLGVAALAAGYQYFAKDLPSPEQIEELSLTNFETDVRRLAASRLAAATRSSGTCRVSFPMTYECVRIIRHLNGFSAERRSGGTRYRERQSDAR